MLERPKKRKTLRIRIRNFQSIEELDFEAKGLVLIRGHTNSGKTAIQRAMRFLIEGGRYSFERILKRGKSSMSIDLWHNGNHVSLFRSEKDNTFSINGKTWTKVGMTRPEELAALGYRVLDVNGKKLLPQFATQHGPLFLVGEDSDSVTRAAALASLTTKHIHGVTQASRQGSQEEKRLKATARQNLEQAQEIERQLEKYKNVEGIKENLATLEGKWGVWEQKRQRLERLKRLVLLRQQLIKRKGLAEELRGIRTPIEIDPTKPVKLYLLKRKKLEIKDLEGRKKQLETVRALKAIIVPEPKKLVSLKGLKQEREELELRKGQLEILLEMKNLLLPDPGRWLQLKGLEVKRYNLEKRGEKDRKKLEINISCPIPDAAKWLKLGLLEKGRKGIEKKKAFESQALTDSLEELEQVQSDLQKVQEENPVCPVCERSWK